MPQQLEVPGVVFKVRLAGEKSRHCMVGPPFVISRFFFFYRGVFEQVARVPIVKAEISHCLVNGAPSQRQLRFWLLISPQVLRTRSKACVPAPTPYSVGAVRSTPHPPHQESLHGRAPSN